MSNLTIIDKAQGKWVLVEFCVGKNNELPTVAAIPGQWLVVFNQSLMAYFPEEFSYAKLKSAIMKNLMYEESWPIFRIKFIMPVPYETYQEARKDEHDMEEFEGTDLEEFAKNMDRFLDKRTRTPQGHRHSSEDSDVPMQENDSCEEDNCKTSLSLPPLPSPPRNSEAAYTLEKSKTKSLESVPWQVEPVVPSCNPQHSSKESSGTENTMMLSKENKEDALMDLLLQVLDRQGKMEKQMERSFNILNDKIDSCLDSVAELSIKFTSMQQQNEETLTLEDQRICRGYFSFPIQVKRELIEFDEMLKSDVLYKSFMVSYSKDRMTASAADGPLQSRFNALVNSAMKCLIQNDLALQYNLKGRPNSVKDSFENFNGVMDMIFQATKEKLRLVNGPDISTEQCSHAVGEWLRQAKGRTAEAIEKRRQDQAERRKKQREEQKYTNRPGPES